MTWKFWARQQQPENTMKAIARGAMAYGSADVLYDSMKGLQETASRRNAIQADIANWGLINAQYENMLVSRRGADLPEDSIIAYGSHSGNTQSNKMGTIGGVALGFVLLVALLGLLSMMGIIPDRPTQLPVTPTTPAEWELIEVPCPPNVEPGTVIREERTPDLQVAP